MPSPWLPTFNLTCGIWNDVDPNTDPMTFASDCQLYYGRQQTFDGFIDFGDTTIGQYVPPMFLRLPKETDIKLPVIIAGTVTTRTYVECPVGTGRFYRVLDFDDAHKGFPNEYRVACLRKAFTDTLWPDPVT